MCLVVSESANRNNSDRCFASAQKLALGHWPLVQVGDKNNFAGRIFSLSTRFSPRRTQATQHFRDARCLKTPYRVVFKNTGIDREPRGVLVIKSLAQVDSRRQHVDTSEVKVPSDVITCKKNLFTWLSASVDYFNEQKAGIVHCWQQTKLLRAWDKSVQKEAMFKVRPLFPNLENMLESSADVAAALLADDAEAIGQAELCIEDQQPLGTTSWDDEDPEAFVEGNAFPAQAVENEEEWVDVDRLGKPVRLWLWD